MTTQDTENQTGGAEPQDAPIEENQEPESGEPGAPAVNPYEALNDQALQFIIRSRQLGKDPLIVLKEVLADIAD